MYPIFQIDANLGYPAAVLVGRMISLAFVALILHNQQNALIQAPDVPDLYTPLTVTLLPALPPQWSSGSIKGVRIRGGISVNFQWSGGKPTQAVFTVDANARSRDVRVLYADNLVGEFATTSRSTQRLNFA
jgi:alpha-L-fucosidase 2